MEAAAGCAAGEAMAPHDALGALARNRMISFLRFNSQILKPPAAPFIVLFIELSS